MSGFKYLPVTRLAPPQCEFALVLHDGYGSKMGSRIHPVELIFFGFAWLAVVDRERSQNFTRRRENG